MKIAKQNLVKALGFASLLACASSAMALPSFDSFEQLADYQTDNGFLDTTQVIFDNRNPDVVYVPWDQVEIVNDSTGRPKFGFAYTEIGGKINLVVKAGWSDDSREVIEDFLDEGYIVRPMPVIAGAWTIAGYDLEAGIPRTVARAENLPNFNETVFPTSPMGLSFNLEADEVKLMVGLLQTGASLIVNYNYSFRAATPQTSFEMTIDQERVTEIFNERVISVGRNCILRPNGGADVTSCNEDGFDLVWDRDEDGNSTVNMEESSFSTLDVETLTRVAIEEQAVTIRDFNMTEDERENARRLAERYIQSTFFDTLAFTPVDSSFGLDEADYCKIEGHPCTTVECQGYGQALLRKSLSDIQRVTKTVTLESWGTQILRGHVGYALSQACTEMPDNIVYIPGDGSEFQFGCPTSWNPRVLASGEQPDNAEPGSVTTDPTGEVYGDRVPAGSIPVPGFGGNGFD